MKLDKPQTPKRLLFVGIILIFWIVIIVSFVGCGHSKEGLRFQEMCKDIPKNFNSADIRKAVSPLFSKYKFPHYLDGGVVPVDEIPNEIKSLPFFSGDTNWIETGWVGTDGRGLIFVTGSGFGHWGIIVAKDEADPRINVGSGYGTTPWTNGIYFYSEFR